MISAPLLDRLNTLENLSRQHFSDLQLHIHSLRHYQTLTKIHKAISKVIGEVNYVDEERSSNRAEKAFPINSGHTPLKVEQIEAMVLVLLV